MVRTNTTSLSSITLERPNNNLVTFAFPDESSGYVRTTIILPQGSNWSASPHWHERYTEHFHVVKGRVRLFINGKARVIGPEDGEQMIERYAVHDFMRADRDEEESEEGDVVVEEWCEPADGLKDVFFRNLTSIIKDTENMGLATDVQLFWTGDRFDNFPVLVNGAFSWYVTHAVGVAARCCGWLLGMKSWYEEYTPERIRSVAASGGMPKKAKDL